MTYDLSDSIDIAKFNNQCKKLINLGSKAELTKLSNTRSSQQNRALHMYFTMISDELNELGIQFQYEGLKGMTLEMRYTSDIVKNFVWKPIQLSMFDTDSTTKLNTDQMNNIIDVITVFFGERGVVLEFPNIESLIKIN